MADMVRRRINKGKEPKRPRQPVPAFVLMLLEALGKIKEIVPKSSRYTRHQGPRECARRVRQMARTKQPTTST